MKTKSRNMSPNRKEQKRYRIASKKRFFCFLLICAALLLGSSSMAFGFSPFAKAEANYASVEIVAGDTIWNIAQMYSDEHTNLRRFVDQICRLNQISAGEIYPGQIILIPLEG